MALTKRNPDSRTETSAVVLPHQTHVLPIRIGTSLPVGRVVPLDFFPVLREDQLSANLNWSVQMNPTHELLVNPPRIRLQAWFVSKLAEPRFSGSKNVLLRSYFGKPETDTEDATVIPYFVTETFSGGVSANAIARYLGLHFTATQAVNVSPFEAYNLIWNHKAETRSDSIEHRELDDMTLAPAFWFGGAPFSDVVPRVDTGLIAGEVPLTVVDAKLPVSGIYQNKVPGTTSGTGMVDTTGASPPAGAALAATWDESANNKTLILNKADGSPDINATLAASGIRASLAAIQQGGEMARFAREWMKREGWKGNHEFFIDAMLQGFAIPEGHLLKPILLNEQIVETEQVLDTATDGASLGQKFTLGMARGTFGFRLPRQSEGGTVMILAEVLPEQLYEDMADPLLFTDTVAGLPNRMVDEIRSEPFWPILSKDVSVYHSEPNKRFGYEAVNAKWARHPVRFGGEMHRVAGGPNGSVARRAIYPTEYVDPSLTEDFYLSEQINNQPFMEPDSDPLKIGMRGTCSVNGLTLVGYAIESDENYDKVVEAAVAGGVV